jgi:hypothetical protein
VSHKAQLHLWSFFRLDAFKEQQRLATMQAGAVGSFAQKL